MASVLKRTNASDGYGGSSAINSKPINLQIKLLDSNWHSGETVTEIQVL